MIFPLDSIGSGYPNPVNSYREATNMISFITLASLDENFRLTEKKLLNSIKLDLDSLNLKFEGRSLLIREAVKFCIDEGLIEKKANVISGLGYATFAEIILLALGVPSMGALTASAVIGTTASQLNKIYKLTNNGEIGLHSIRKQLFGGYLLP